MLDPEKEHFRVNRGSTKASRVHRMPTVFQKKSGLPLSSVDMKAPRVHFVPELDE